VNNHSDNIYWKDLEKLNNLLENQYKFDGRLIFFEKIINNLDKINHFLCVS